MPDQKHLHMNTDSKLYLHFLAYRVTAVLAAMGAAGAGTLAAIIRTWYKEDTTGVAGAAGAARAASASRSLQATNDHG